MNKDEERSLFEEGAALEKALEFPLKPAGSEYAWPGEPPWGLNRTAARKERINDRAKLYFKQLAETAEEYSVPPSEVVERKYRMQEWIEECALWKENESFEERDFRLKQKRDQLFGRDATTSASGRPLGGRCCASGLIRTDATVMARTGKKMVPVNGYVKTCVVCERGQKREAYLKGEKG